MREARGQMNSKYLIISIIWAIILSSCSSTTQSGIAKVEIHVTPSDGYAYCKFTADGWAEGGHESGGPEQIEAIWAAAGAIDTQVYPLETSAIRECVGCVDLFIYHVDGGIVHLSWPVGERHPDRKVQELEALLYEYNVGGW